MGSTAVTAHEYWGYLIRPDKSATPVFEQLLLGVANYINHHIAPWDTQCLTPAKLAAFYRLVGGDYDSLFLDTSTASLSFIYQSLGCYHTLQPERDPYTAPTTPALTPQGFVRWQTVQLLLEPKEHVPFLQEAVKRFDLLSPADGVPFPSPLPREALPTQPDPEISEWHDAVSQKLMLEAQASAARNLPPRPQMALSDIDLKSSRDSSVDSHFIAGTDTAGYSTASKTSYRPPPSTSNPRLPARPPAPQYSNDAPWSPERRRGSQPDHGISHSASWPREAPAPSSYPPATAAPLRPQHHQRTDSDLSTLSTSTSSSSLTTSSASLSPIRYHTQPHPLSSPTARRHSTSSPPHRPASQPQNYIPQQRRNSGSARQKTVRWQDMDDVFDGERYNGKLTKRDGRTGRDLRYGAPHGRGDERARGRALASVGPNTGVRGRRYAGEEWR